MYIIKYKMLLHYKALTRVVNIARTADSENKTIHFQYKIMYKYQCYSNMNHLLNYNLCDR